MTWKDKLPRYAFGTLAFGLVLITSFTFWSIGRTEVPPHELLDTRVEPTTVRADASGMLNVTIYTGSIRRVPCYAQIYRTFANADTNEVVYQTVMIGGRAPMTGKPSEFPFNMALPAARFPHGKYSYTAYVINKCGNGTEVYVATSNMSFFEVAP
jgi:hypothetical protein